ncbi:MAG: Slp family lipoprotein [Gammaproteobacteria bacterium]
MGKITSLLIIFTMALSLVSCATKAPSILQLPESVTSVPLQTSDLKQFIGETIRWGGTIIETKNSKDSSQIIILGYPLDNQARPKTRSRTNTRRFIANFNQFIEPTTYAKDTEITVIGKLARIEKSKIGEFNYEYPVVTVSAHALWRIADDYEYGGPYRYDSYYPGYGYGYYPYYYPYYWGYSGHLHH